MKNYFLFDALIEPEKTAPIVTAAQKLIQRLGIDAPSFKKAKADFGSEMIALDTLKFLEHYAYNLTLSAMEQRALVCIEQSSFICHAHTKDLLTSDEKLYSQIAERLAKQNFTLNLDVEVLSLEQLLIQEVGVEKLANLVQKPFTNFQTAHFLGTNACRARKYKKETLVHELLDLIQLKTVRYESAYESDGFEVRHASSSLAHKLASKALLDMFDNAADFVLISDARSFVMFDACQKELEKVAGREIGLSVLSVAQLLLLALGETSVKNLGFDRHKVAITLL